MNELILTKENQLTISAEDEIVNVLKELAELEERAKSIKNLIKGEMASRGLVKIETEKVTITYISPTTRETFDSKSFRKDHPDMYDDYVKLSNVSDSVRVAIK